MQITASVDLKHQKYLFYRYRSSIYPKAPFKPSLVPGLGKGGPWYSQGTIKLRFPGNVLLNFLILFDIYLENMNLNVP